MAPTISTKTTKEGNDEIIVVLVTFAAFIVIHQTSVTSKHYGTTFGIQIHMLPLYLNKLMSLRCFLMLVGACLEFLIERTSIVERRYMSIVYLSMLLITRIIFVALLYTSTGLAIRIYHVLNFEAFCFGLFQMSFFALLPQYSALINMAVDLSMIVVSILQIILDLCFRRNPPLMILMQSFICIFITVTSVMIWPSFILNEKGKITKRNNNSESQVRGNSTEIPTNSSQQTTSGVQNDNSTTEQSGKNENSTNSESLQTTKKGTEDSKGTDAGGSVVIQLINVFSPFMMFGVACFFKEMLFPRVLPRGLLEAEKSRILNVIVPFVYLLGSVGVYSLNKNSEEFRSWDPKFNLLWVLMVPIVIIFVSSMLTIHSTIACFERIINSQKRVFIMTLLLLISFSILRTVSYVGVANTVYYRSEEREDTDIFLVFHNCFCLLLRYFFFKLSIGYHQTRVGLGYVFPNFNIIDRQQGRHTIWYWIKTTIERTIEEIIADMKMNIRLYV